MRLAKFEPGEMIEGETKGSAEVIYTSAQHEQ